MTRKNQASFKVQASRDGHEFHEAWTARKALQLVFPADHFVEIAVEGLSPKDERKAASASVVSVSGRMAYFPGLINHVLQSRH
jgi:hypothetical protein